MSSQHAPYAIAAAIVLTFACADEGKEEEHDHDEFRADVLECEDSVARLADSSSGCP